MDRILIVDDNELARQATKAVLHDNGFDVADCCDARDALEMLHEAECPFDLLLTDISMPEMDGVELAGRVVAASPTTKVLFMTGYAPEGLLSHAATPLKDAPVLFKPFHHYELIAAIHRALTIDVDAMRQRRARPFG